MVVSQQEELNKIDKLICGCDKCELARYRDKAVPGEGAADARIMIIGEGPGEENDKTGRPFVGRGGRILDKYLDEAGLQREEMFLTNIIKCRMPHNATPNSSVVSACQNYLNQQIDVIQPKIIITLGLTAAKLMLNNKRLTLASVCNNIFENKMYKLLCTYHPSSIRYNKEAGEQILNTLIKAKKMTEGDMAL